MSTKDLSTYVPIFDGTNYKEWYDKLEVFAMVMKCNGPMTEDQPADAAALAAFNIIDRQMQGMIRLRLGATYQSHVKATAKLTLTALKTAFGTPGRVGALVEMRSMFQHRMKPNSNPVHEANNLIQCVARLSTAGFALADGLITLAILMALPSDWETLVSTLCSTLNDASFTVAEITAQINREYMRRQASRGRSTISLQDRISERTSFAAEYQGSDATLVSHLTNVKPAVRPSYQGGGNRGKGKQPVREGQCNQYPRCVFQGCRRNHFPAEFCLIGHQRIFYDQAGKQICCQPQVVSPPAGGSSNNNRGGSGCGRGGKRGRGKGKGRGGGTHVIFDESLQYYDQPDYEEFQDYTAMMVDQPTTSGISEVPVSPTAELDAQLDEYNAERPMAPYSEEAVRAMWADESMGPSSFDDIIDTYEEQATYDFDRTCALIHIPSIPESDEAPSFSHPETTVSRSVWEEIEDEDFV